MKKRRIWGRLWLVACGFNAAVGTCFIGAWYYAVPGFSWLDVALCLAALRLVLVVQRSAIPPSIDMQRQLWATFALAWWLILATVVNAFWFGMELGDLLPPLKLGYLALVVAMFRRYSMRYGVREVLIGAALGILTVACEELVLSERTVAGVPLLLNANVTGALLGLGVWFAVFGVLFTRSTVVNLVAGLAFAALSITSFSKGAWLMCAFAMVAGFATVLGRRKTRPARARRVFGVAVGLGAVGVFTVLVVSNLDLITKLITLKMDITAVEGGSLDTRADFLKASLLVARDFPTFGLGYRNFDQTQRLYPDLHLPPLDRLDNAHNLFAQTLATGGVPALVLFCVVFLVPFLVLWQKLRTGIPSFGLRATIWTLSFGVWFLYASVQLQLIANPVFWFFSGLMFGVAPAPREAEVSAWQRGGKHGCERVGSLGLSAESSVEP